MLEKLKLALRLNTTVYDEELVDLLLAGVADLKHIGAQFDATNVTDAGGAVVDVTITDPLVIRAVITYCRMHFGSPEDFDRLRASYDSQKGQMRESSAYGMEAV